MTKSVAASVLAAYPTIAEWASGGPVSPARLADELRAALAFVEGTESPAPAEYDPEGEA